MSCITGLPNCTGTASAERVFNEKPSGAFDCVNTSFTTAQVFDPSTLIIRLDGVALDPDQYVISGDNQGFTLNVDASDPKALGEPPCSDECLRVDYSLTGGSSGSGGCITFL